MRSSRFLLRSKNMWSSRFFVEAEKYVVKFININLQVIWYAESRYIYILHPVTYKFFEVKVLNVCNPFLLRVVYACM